MLCKEKNGMPVGSSVRADTWKLWEMKSSLSFWFPYMTCWLYQRNKGSLHFTQPSSGLYLQGGPSKNKGTFHPKMKRQLAYRLPQICRISKLSGPLLQPNPLPVQLTSDSPRHPVGLGCLGIWRKYANTRVTALSVNNEIS